MEQFELRRLAADLARARHGSEALDRALLAALGWRPAPMAEGVCWLSWGDDPSGAPVWAGAEPRPTRNAADAGRLLAGLAGAVSDPAPPPAEALEACRVIVALLISRGRPQDA